MTWQRKGGILRSVRVSRSQLLGNVLKCQLYQQNLNMMISTIHDDADRGEDDGDSNEDCGNEDDGDGNEDGGNEDGRSGMYSGSLGSLAPPASSHRPAIIMIISIIITIVIMIIMTNMITLKSSFSLQL